MRDSGLVSTFSFIPHIHQGFLRQKLDSVFKVLLGPSTFLDNVTKIVKPKRISCRCTGFGGHLWVKFDIVLHASSKQPVALGILVQFQICLCVQLVTYSLKATPKNCNWEIVIRLFKNEHFKWLILWRECLKRCCVKSIFK